MSQLKTDRLILRRRLPPDRDLFARLNADPMMMEFMPARLDREDFDHSGLPEGCALRRCGLYRLAGPPLQT